MSAPGINTPRRRSANILVNTQTDSVMGQALDLLEDILAAQLETNRLLRHTISIEATGAAEIHQSISVPVTDPVEAKPEAIKVSGKPNRGGRR